MTIQRYHIVDGVKVATPAFFEALRAVNFMEHHGYGWTLHRKKFDIALVIAHAKEIAAERDKTIEVVTKLSGFEEMKLLGGGSE